MYNPRFVRLVSKITKLIDAIFFNISVILHICYINKHFISFYRYDYMNPNYGYGSNYPSANPNYGNYAPLNQQGIWILSFYD